MRAAKCGQLGCIQCEDVDVRPPEEGEIVVKTLLSAICGSDLHVVFDGVPLPEAPLPPGYPGHEGVGEVVESRAADFPIGLRVLTCPDARYSGCFAEYQTLPAAFCLPLPQYDGPLSDLLMAQQLGTVIFALRKDPCDLVGRTVMVMGQGSAGVFFSYMAKRMGAKTVIVSDRSEARLAEAHRTGADVRVKADDQGENVRALVMEHTDGRGVDFLVEAVGRRKSLLQSVDLMRDGGEMLLFGLPDTTAAVPFNFHDFFRKRLKANCIYGAQHEADHVSFRLALDLIAKRQIDISNLVSHTLPLEQIQEALELAQHLRDNVRKVAISFP